MSVSSFLPFNQILYDTPEIYKSGGDQTQIESRDWVNEIKEKFPTYEDSINQLIQIRQWIKKTFTSEQNKGTTIGKLNVEQLVTSKIWHGCHDLAHIFAATIRLIGYPCVLVETTSVSWSKEYVKNDYFGEPRGHNFTEIYVNGKWILFDPMSPAYLEDYNHSDPNIPICTIYADEPEGFYVIAKGKDCWDYGIQSLDDLINLQKAAALKFFKV